MKGIKVWRVWEWVRKRKLGEDCVDCDDADTEM